MLPDPADPDRKVGPDFFDSVGIAFYDIDIHPRAGEPPRLAAVCLTPAAGRVHRPLRPRERPAGRAGLRGEPPGRRLGPDAPDRMAGRGDRRPPRRLLPGHDVEPAQVRHTPGLLAAFQAQLEADGITTRWSEVLPPAESTPTP